MDNMRSTSAAAHEFDADPGRSELVEVADGRSSKYKAGTLHTSASGRVLNALLFF